MCVQLAPMSCVYVRSVSANVACMCVQLAPMSCVYVRSVSANELRVCAFS